MAIRSFLTRGSGDLAASMALAEGALQTAPDMAPALKAVVSFTLRWCHLDMGDLVSAQGLLEEATRGDERGSHYVALFSYGLQGEVTRSSGRWGSGPRGLDAIEGTGSTPDQTLETSPLREKGVRVLSPFWHPSGRCR